MTATLDDVLAQLQNIKLAVADLVNNRVLSANQIRIINGLSDLDKRLGLIQAGEFRVGNELDPGKGFTGVRMGFPAFDYSSRQWHLVGINNDIIQFGLNAEDGTAWAGGGAIRLTSGGILVYNSSTQTGSIESDGDVKFGSNLASPTTTSFCIFTNDQVYNGESVGAGDLLVGDNSTGQPNFIWDASAGELRFRIGVLDMNIVSTGSLSSPSAKFSMSASYFFSVPAWSGSPPTFYDVVFDNEEYDDVEFIIPGISNTNITVPTGYGGRFEVGYFVRDYTDANLTNVYLEAFVAKNDTTLFINDIVWTPLAGSRGRLGASGEVELAAGDFVNLSLSHGDDIAHDIDAALWLKKTR